MANRSGMGTGLAIMIGLLLMTTVTFFVTTVIFAAEARKQQGITEEAQQNLEQALGSAGRDSNWDRYSQAAGRQGVVPYLTAELSEVMRAAGGTSRDTSETLKEKIATENGGTPIAALALIKEQQATINDKENQLAAAERAKTGAENARETALDRVREIENNFRETRQAMQGEIDALSAELEGYRIDVADTRDDIETKLADRGAAYDASVAEFQEENQELRDELAQRDDQIRRLSGETEDDRLTAPDEASLVDARIVGINDAEGEVYINRGRADRVVLGMTFQIYGRGVSLLPDDEGNAPRGKAVIEVTRIEGGTAVARVLDATRGNPILPGDRCVNAVWDPNKEYRFVIFGNFDTNFDSFATPQELDDIEAIITEWGGIVEDELTGNIDFVVLGERPLLPPPPRVDDPFPVVDLYLKKQEIVNRYNELFESAGARSIPVLNQNRLYSLTGLDKRPE